MRIFKLLILLTLLILAIGCDPEDSCSAAVYRDGDYIRVPGTYDESSICQPNPDLQDY